MHIPGLWIPSLQRKKYRFIMNIACDDGFSVQDQLFLWEALNTFQVLTVSNITTMDESQIKNGIVDDILDDRRSQYRFPRPIPWNKEFSRVVQNLVTRITVGCKSLVIPLGAFTNHVQSSQSYLFHLDPFSKCLVDSRTNITVENKIWPTSLRAHS